MGLAEDRLARLKAPAGLDIHGVEPAEFALSIIAEIVERTLEAQGYRARAALTCGRAKLQHNLMRGRLDIIAGSVDEAARLEPAMKQLDDVSVLASEDFRKHHQLDEVAFGFEERQIRLEKPFGQRHAGERLPCYKAIDRRNL
jgi:XdhC Rossmann domain